MAERTYFTYVRSTRYTCDDLHTLYQSGGGLRLVDWSDWNGMDWYNFGPVRNPTSHITGITFIFLAEQLTSFSFDVQGMKNAFVIRYKYCLSTSSLIRLSNESFYCFPDLCIHYWQIWSECYARTIFNSIDHLRQEMWRFLCRYGQSQGLFPKQMLTLYFPTVFTTYISNYLGQFGIPSQECSLFEPQ